MTAAALIRAGDVQPMRPWPRYALSPEAWRAMADALREGPEPDLLGLWADTAHVHALFMADAPLLASVRVEAGMFAALSPARPAAAAFERMVHDLWGYLPGHGADARPLLDHGCWPSLRPLSARPVPNAAASEAPEFLGTAGPDLLRIPIGPVGSPLGPVQLRITAAGETVARLEAGLGYAHRGILALMRGKPAQRAAPLAGRIAAGSTVAHAAAFARAVEAIADIELPPRAHALRGVMAELERVATGLADIGEVTPGPLQARCADLREDLLRASQAAFSHRLMMDCVVPGGASTDLAPPGLAALIAMLGRIAAATPALQCGLDGIKGRTVGVGAVGPGLAEAERSAARTLADLFPYGRPAAAGPAPRGHDVDARLRRSLAEIRESLALLRGWLAGLPSGPVSVRLPTVSGEGLGLADGPRGDVWHWVRLEAGMVAASFARDPVWSRWPLIEAACRGARLSDLPLILRSFNPAVAGMEL